MEEEIMITPSALARLETEELIFKLKAKICIRNKGLEAQIWLQLICRHIQE